MSRFAVAHLFGFSERWEECPWFVVLLATENCEGLPATNGPSTCNAFAQLLEKQPWPSDFRRFWLPAPMSGVDAKGCRRAASICPSTPPSRKTAGMCQRHFKTLGAMALASVAALA